MGHVGVRLLGARRRRTWQDEQHPGTLAATGIFAALAMLLVLFPMRLSSTTPDLVIAISSLALVARLFGALVLARLADGAAEPRLRWVAAGLALLAIGGYIVEVLPALRGVAPAPGMVLQLWPAFRTLGGVFILIGVAGRPSRAIGRLGPAFAVGVLVQLGAGLAFAQRALPLTAFPIWYWALATIPLILSVVTLLAALRHPFVSGFATWLPLAIVGLATSYLYSLIWPPLHGHALDTAYLLRLLTSLGVLVGGALDLQHLASDLAVRLRVEQENARRDAALAETKARFLSLIAHELGTPLAAIRALADILELPTLSDEQRAKTLAALQVEADLLGVLVADVQAAAHLERGDFAVRPRPVSLARLLDEAQAFAATLPGAHRVTRSPAVDADVLGDPERIGQVLRNLLSNAAKYSPAGSAIALRARVEARLAHIEVADQGYGIDPGDLPRIFDEFGRGQRPGDDKIPGLGLGLYLSRRIVQAHGSDIVVDSAPGRGSAFGFTLEVAR